MSAERLSIALPVHNGEDYLAVALDSILGQSFGEFDLFVSENASTDTTRDILADYSRRDPRLRVSHTPHLLSQVDNINRAARLPDSRWVKLICHDDLMHLECMGRIAAALDRAEAGDVGVIANGNTHLFSNGYESPPPNASLAVLKHGRDAVVEILGGRNRFAVPAVTTITIRKDVFERVGGWNPRYRYLVDLFCWLEMLIKANYLYVPDAVTTTRVHPAQAGTLMSRELVSVNDLRAFVPDYLARHRTALCLPRAVRWRARLRPHTEAARKIGSQLLVGRVGIALAMARTLPPAWLPLLMPLIARAMVAEHRRLRPYAGSVPRELLVS